MTAAQLAQEQQNWQSQFDFSKQQYQDSLSQYQDSVNAQNRENAYNLAMTMLSAGVMPDASTLTTAGISTSEAMAMRLAALGGSSGGSSSKTSSSSATSQKKTTSGSKSNTSSTSNNTIVAMNPDYYRAFGNSIAAQLGGGSINAAIGNVDSRWSEMSQEQKDGILRLFNQYGYTYQP